MQPDHKHNFLQPVLVGEIIMNRRNFIKSAALAAMSGTMAAGGALTAQAVERSSDTASIRSYNPDMRYRTFGKTGEKVSVLGFGTMRLPTIGDDYEKIDVPLATRLVRRAVEGGLNYIDTSWPYHSNNQMKGGASEPFVGQVVKEIGRKNVYIASKLPIWAIHSRADMDTFLNAQLKRLQTDHVDFYLVHSIRRAEWDNMIRLDLRNFLDKAVQSGRVRYVGFSFHDRPSLYQEVMDYYDWSFNQHVCNYYDINFQAGMIGIRQAALRDMGFVAMESLMGGMLATQLPKEALDVLAATGIKRSPAAWAFRWVWNQPEVSVCISGMNKMEQVEENLRQARESDIPMSPVETEAINKVRAILKSKGDLGCIECGTCSCPMGVDIPLCFSMYNANKAFQVIHISHHNYGMAVKGTPSGAEACDGCNRCAGQCPEGVNIPAGLKKVAAYFKDAKTGW